MAPAWLALLTLGLCAPGAAAALEQPMHERWGTEEGLPQSSVLAMTFDPRGDLILGTQEGLARFDGRKVQGVGAALGLPCAWISALATSREGQVLVGTNGCGAFRLDGDQATRVPEIPADARILSMAASPDGAVLVATDRGLHAVGRATRALLFAGEAVTAVTAGPRGEVAFAVRGRVAKLEAGQVRFLDAAGALPGEEITGLAFQGEALWVATRDAGLVRLAPQGRTWFDLGSGLPSMDVQAVAVLGDGALWVATANGVAQLRGERFVPLDLEGAPRSPVALTSQGQDLIFVGDSSTGLHLLRPRRIATLGTAEGLPDPVVWSLLQDRDGAIWTGTEHGGLGRWVEGRFQPLPASAGVPLASVYSVVQAHDGTLWAGTAAGLFHWDGARGQTFTTADGLPSSTVYGLVVDAQGALWACTSRGLVRRDPGGALRDVTRSLGMPPQACTTLALEPGGALWVGGPDVFGRIADGSFRAAPLHGRPDVNALLFTAQGELLVGTASGLGRLHRGQLAWLDEARGLFDRQVLALTEASGSFWLSSNRGPFRIGARELRAAFDGQRERVSSEAFGVHDGLVNAECNAFSNNALLVARDGTVWVPTMAGVAILDPRRLATARPAPTPYIEGVYDPRTNQPLGAGPVRTLPAGVRDLHVDYSAAEFAEPKRLQFRYRLEGNDPAWLDAGERRSAWYTNLRPGTYRLRVEARLGQGDWVPAAQPLTVALRPYFYETWWFAVGALLSCLLLAAAGVRARLAALRRHERELQRRVDERTTALKAALVRTAQSEASFRSLAERLPIALVVMRGGAFVFANSEALRMTGCASFEQLRTMPLARFVLAEEEEISARRQRALAEGQLTGAREGRLVRLDGTVLTAQLWGLPMLFEGEPAQVALALDVTERRALEQKLQVSERMASVGTLAAGVAHEINNPLAYLFSNLVFVTEESEALVAAARAGAQDTLLATWSEVKEALAEARQGAQRVQRIVADLKTLSRPSEAGNKPFELLPVIESTLNLARTGIRHRAQLETTLAPLPLAHGNGHRIGQVLLNLLVNAGQAIPEGADQENRVWLTTGLADDGRIFVEVGDTGCGIPPQNLPRLFDPFFTTKPVGVGTGLGLSICHGIVQACGGEIRVQSEVGKGSVFRVLLQRADAAAGQEESPREPQPPAMAGSGA